MTDEIKYECGCQYTYLGNEVINKVLCSRHARVKKDAD